MDWKILKERAYVPYSKKPMACIIEGASGAFYPGVRIENVSFPITIPAIQAACCCCLAEGDTPKNLLKESSIELEQEKFWVDEFDLDIKVRPEINAINFNDPAILLESKVLETLISLLDKAVTIHSNFPVSALLFCNDSKVIPGSNVEVSEWTKGLCAERLAIAKAISYGHSDLESMSLHTLKGEFSSPCGACRQVILEHMPDNKIEFFHADHTLSVHYTKDLLPLSFSSNSLTK